MNRKERRSLEKKIGVIKYRQKMNFKEKMEEIRKNIQSGKERESEMKESIRRQLNEESDKKAAMELSSLATTLMIKNNLSWHEALEAAKSEIELSYWSNEENI